MNFTKLVASGNNFILLDFRKNTKSSNLNKIAKQLCDVKSGIGADGLLVLESSRRANVKMRIFNADGSEAEMCGNGARCVVYFLTDSLKKTKGQIKIDTKAGILKAQAYNNKIRINMTGPKGVKLNSTLKLKGHPLKFNFVNTGVPHAVILCDGIEGIDVNSLGRVIRFHKRFNPAGTNVNFVEPVGINKIKVRTYERGVEGETLACGTGSVASAIIYALKLRDYKLIKGEGKFNIDVQTASCEILKIEFIICGNKISDVWLQGGARIICGGQFTHAGRC